MHYRVTVICIFLIAGGVSLSGASGQHVMHSRVPADKLTEARSLTSPFPVSPETVEKGKALYNGKGACVNCHGQNGAGDGPVAASLTPSPRNFQHHGFWRHRTAGEIFWVIKFGSPDTSMIGFGGVLTDEEIWAIIQYERSFAGMGHGKGMGRGGMGACENESCGR
jgi:mono/diheme cytochrome c family protein